MRKTIALLLISSTLLAGCGGSRLNPMNWFGGARSTPRADANPLIPESSGFSLRRQPRVYAGTPVDQITGLTVERIPGGAIIRVEGVADYQGAYEVKVDPDTEGDEAVDGVLAYTLKARKTARRFAVVGPVQTRRITAAHYVSDEVLREVRTIRVAGVRNVMTVRR
ncbi:hypothetical protein ATO6_10320 [Oceanicola sp. 22II-s10i]|uniref:hypothetical protein n=1 Tax=Oceanicola sp. 22II-s10i TaxID=1317116 RepID=UPI000B522947|nr:hypothetical protein [Oceanicola sp. 22II-s10i]OWU84723.1 hypothetical protein ATO6_10320 [Oceanicola sp. 22II-s10i]